MEAEERAVGALHKLSGLRAPPGRVGQAEGRHCPGPARSHQVSRRPWPPPPGALSQRVRARRCEPAQAGQDGAHLRGACFERCAPVGPGLPRFLRSLGALLAGAVYPAGSSPRETGPQTAESVLLGSEK